MSEWWRDRDGYLHYYRPGKPGWSRRWHRVVEAAKVVVGAVLFLAALYLVFWTIYLLSPVTVTVRG